MAFQPNPNYRKFELPEGYKDCGFQFSLSDEVRQCVVELRHAHRQFDNSMYKNRCTDVISICDQCKIVWHTDMSD